MSANVTFICLLPHLPGANELTHWPWENWIEFQVLNFPDNFTDWWLRVQIMAWCRQAASHYLSQCWPRSLSPYGVTIPQWINVHGHVSIPTTNKAFPFPLQWRHNDHDGASNHQPHGCLLNRLFRRRSKKTSKLRVTGLCVGPVNSPRKGPITRKIFPFDNVIMVNDHTVVTKQRGVPKTNTGFDFHNPICYFVKFPAKANKCILFYPIPVSNHGSHKQQ